MSLQVEVADVARVGPAPAPPLAETRRRTVIRPARGRQWLNLRELWHYRDLLFLLGWRDIQVRYKQTLLGAAWALLQPLLMMAVFTLFLGRLAGAGAEQIPYPLFVCAGLLPWNFFAGCLTNGSNSVVGSERLITKVYFPRLAIPFAACAAALVDFAISCGLLLVLMLWYGVTPGAGLLWAPAVFAAVLLAGLGVGTLLAALNVRYRDFRYVVPFLVQIWMFATPTIYLNAALPASGGGLARWVATLNPMAGLIGAFRAALLDQPFPWGAFLVSAACAVLVFVLGCFYFRKAESGFADVI